MATIKDISEGRSDVFRLPLASIGRKLGWNVRDSDFNPDDDEDLTLARSIAAEGVKEPLTVVMDGVEGVAYVTNGHRRLAAVHYANTHLGAEIKLIGVQTEGRFVNDADQVLSMITRNSGKPLKPLETARVYRRLLDFGWSEDEIARRVGRTRQHVTATLNLMAMPAEAQTMVKAGEVSATLAQAVVRRHKGNGAAATGELRQAVAKAKASGKTRATAKHAEKAAPMPVDGDFARATLRSILGWCSPCADGHELSRPLTLTAQEFDALKALSGDWR